MTDYEYILQQAKKFHFTGWNDEELRKCVDMLPNLSRQELINLTMNRWTKEAKVLRESIFNILDNYLQSDFQAEPLLELGGLEELEKPLKKLEELEIPILVE